MRWSEEPDIQVQFLRVAPNKEYKMNRYYKSKSGKYTGSIVGNGDAKQCILDKNSQKKLARYNLLRVQEQNR